MNMIVSAAATSIAATAIPTPADANADPIFAAIEAFRRADAAMDAWVEASEDDFPDELGRQFSAAMDAVIHTRPTTPAGLAALTRWARERNDWIGRNGSEWPPDCLRALTATIDDATHGMAGLEPWSPAAAPDDKPDPIFAAIAAHRVAIRAHLATLAREYAIEDADAARPNAVARQKAIADGTARLTEAVESGEITLAPSDYSQEMVIRVLAIDALRQVEPELFADDGPSAELTAAREQTSAAFKDMDDAAVELANTLPTTMAGLLALLDHIDQFNRGEIRGERPSAYTEHELWPNDMADDDVIGPRGNPVEMPFAFWVLRNVQAALVSLTAAAMRNDAVGLASKRRRRSRIWTTPR